MKTRTLTWALLLVSTACLFPGIQSPLFRLKTTTGDFVADTLLSPIANVSDSQSMSLLGLVGKLLKDQEYLLGSTILIFSVFFPTAKLIALFVLMLTSNWPTSPLRLWTIATLERAGGWSYFDVLIVGVLIVALSDFPFADLQPQVGLYFFAASVLANMTASFLIESHGGTQREHHKLTPKAHSTPSYRLVTVTLGALALLVVGVSAPSYSLRPSLGNPLLDLLLKSEFPEAFGDDEYSLVRSVATLFESGFFALSILVAAMVIVVPFARVSALLWIQAYPAWNWPRQTLHSLTSWSLLLVAGAAILLAGVKDFPFGTRVVPQWGCACFMAAGVLTLVGQRWTLAASNSTHHTLVMPPRGAKRKVYTRLRQFDGTWRRCGA